MKMKFKKSKGSYKPQGMGEEDPPEIHTDFTKGDNRKQGAYDSLGRAISSLTKRKKRSRR